MKLSLSAVSTLNAPFAEDVRAYAAAGFDAIGPWEFKLPEDDGANRALLRDHALAVSNCVPAVPSFLQLAIPGMEGPADPAERLAALGASIRRFAQYEPDCVVVLSGPLGRHSEAEGRAIVSEGLRHVAAEARTAGVRLGFEPVHPAQRETAGFVTSLALAGELLAEAAVDDVGIMGDTFNLAHEDTQAVVAVAGRLAGLHVADEPDEPAPGVRALPIPGGRSAELLRALRGAGWDGILDVEIFSTPDAFWALSADEAARRAYAAVSSLG